MLRLPSAGACLILYLAATSLRVRESRIQGDCLGADRGRVSGRSVFYVRVLSPHRLGGRRSSLVMGEEAINPNIFATRLLLPLALSVGAFFRFVPDY